MTDWRRELLLCEIRVADAERRRQEAVGQLAAWQAQAHALDAELDATRATLSWRVTRPLRAVRRRKPAAAPAGGAAHAVVVESALDPATALVDRVGERLAALAAVLAPGRLEDPFDSFARAAVASGRPAHTIAWLAAVAAAGRYPGDDELDVLARAVRLDGEQGLATAMVDLTRLAARAGVLDAVAVDVRRDEVLVDVTHTATHDALTGIQRVVREAVSRWIGEHPLHLVVWDDAVGGYRRLAECEEERFAGWRQHVTGSMQRREPTFAHEGPVVPLDCRLVVPELAAEPGRSAGLRVLGAAGVLGRLGVLVYDTVPVVAAELAPPGMAGGFAEYVAALKHTHRVAAISSAAADEVRALCSVFASHGLPCPEVRAIPLTGDTPPVDEVTVASFRQRHRVDPSRTFLVVGSREPRKNHAAVLEAAELLWREGRSFTLLLVGGGGWRSAPVDGLVERLADRGRPIVVLGHASDADLSAAYRSVLATVFPSIAEGFGIPLAESLGVGTPVVTSSHGAMAEVVAGGGGLLVDPRDPGALATAMASLLDDPELVSRLRAEAAARPPRGWAEYAAELWQFLAAE